MHNDPQSSELFPEIRLDPAAPKKRMVRNAKAPALSPAQPSRLSGTTDAEGLACALEAHPDYRVQRRLKPCLQWPGAAGQAVARIAVLDTETTGLDQSKEKIIELALLCLDVDTATGLPVGPVQVYDGLEDPGKPIPKEITGITGITDADVSGQRLDEPRIAELLRGVDLVIAHNAGFDRPFVEARLAQFRGLPWACSFADIDWKAQGRSSAKLESLAQAQGWFYEAHRAEMDCHALLAVLAARLPLAQHTGLAQLMAEARKPSFRLQATQAPFDAKDLLKSRGYRWSAEQRVWHTRLADDQTLQAEFAWLKAHVYLQRSATVQVEKLVSEVRYSNRPGELMYQQL